MWAPLFAKYKPVKRLLARDCDNDSLDCLQLKRRQRSNFSTLGNCCPKILPPVPLLCFSELEQNEGTGSGKQEHTPAHL